MVGEGVGGVEFHEALFPFHGEVDGFEEIAEFRREGRHGGRTGAEGGWVM